MNAMGGLTAFGTLAISGLTMCDDDKHVASVMYCLRIRLGGDQIAKPKMGSHGADSPSETRPVESKTSSRISQTQICTPEHMITAKGQEMD